MKKLKRWIKLSFGWADLKWHDGNGQLSCGLPHLVALGIFGALTNLKSAANDLPYTSQVALIAIQWFITSNVFTLVMLLE